MRIVTSIWLVGFVSLALAAGVVAALRLMGPSLLLQSRRIFPLLHQSSPRSRIHLSWRDNPPVYFASATHRLMFLNYRKLAPTSWATGAATLTPRSRVSARI